MPTDGYIRTSRNQEPGHPGSDPEVQRRQLVDAGVEPGRIYADVVPSGAEAGNSRGQWHLRIDSSHRATSRWPPSTASGDATPLFGQQRRRLDQANMSAHAAD